MYAEMYYMIGANKRYCAEKEGGQMDKNKMLEYAYDLKSDLKFAFETGEGQTPNYKDVAVMEWLIKQAKTLERLREENRNIENASDVIGEGFLNIDPQLLTSICLKCRVDLGNCICE